MPEKTAMHYFSSCNSHLAPGLRPSWPEILFAHGSGIMNGMTVGRKEKRLNDPSLDDANKS